VLMLCFPARCQIPNFQIMASLETLDISAEANPMPIFTARWAALEIDVAGCERSLPHTLR